MPTVATVMERLLSLPTKFFVDIGASNCPGESQSEILVQNGWAGIMFECDPVKFVPLSQRMKAYPNVKVVSQKVTPDTIVSALKDAHAPDDFYLSLDIDGYDFHVLTAILSEYHPQLIISEINEKIPPPIKFSVNYTPNYWWSGWHFFGYSISMLEDIKGYKVESLDFNNVIMTPGTQERSLADIYREGYWNMPHGRPGYNADFDPIYSMPYDDQIAFINTKFADRIGEFTIFPHGK